MTRNQITAFLALSVTFWVILLLLRGVPVTVEMLVPFSGVVGAVSIVLLIFDKWIWHWLIFRGWLINRPYLKGTWRAEIVSDWVDPATGKVVGPITAYMVIRQTASTISFRLLAAESRSETVSAGIETCPDGTFEINYAYRNKPRAEYRHRSEVHYGAILLVADCAVPDRLEGEYWTDRKTTGSVVLTDRSKALAANFVGAESLFSI